MKDRILNLLLPPLVLLVPLSLAVGGEGDKDSDPDEKLHEEYGFSGLIISKLNDGVSNLTSGDVNGDGKVDLLVVNNARSKIEILFQGEAEEEESDDDLVNEMPDEVFFDREGFPTEEKVTSLTVADLNGDGRDELIFLGDSGKVTLAFRDADGKFSRVDRMEVPNHSSIWRALQTADLDRNGKMDLLVLGTDATYIFMQEDDGRFQSPRKIPNATKGANSFRIQDLDGDGIMDLFYVSGNSEWPFRYRLGEPDLAFGPEVQSRFAAVRAFDMKDLEGGRGSEAVAVRRKSGRLALLRFGDRDANSDGELSLSSLRNVSYEALTKKDVGREEVVADLDGDGISELIVSEPSGARVVVYRSLLGGEGAGSTAYPSFVGVSRPRLGDVDGDGRDELVLAAPDEGAVGIAEIDEEGDIAFPVAVGIPDGQDLLALDVADTGENGRAEIWLLLGDGRGKSRARRLVTLSPGGEVVRDVKLRTLKTDPNDLWMTDLNRDGVLDAMVFVPKEVPVILLADGESEDGYSDVKADRLPGLGILEGVSRRAFAQGDVDGDGQEELLVPGPNFVRSIYIDADGKPAVVAQDNLENVGSQVALVGLGDLDGDGTPEILVRDTSTSNLLVLGKDGEGRREVARVDLGSVAPNALVVSDLDANGKNDVLALSDNEFSVIQNGGRDPVFSSVADLEIPLKDIWVGDLAIGDVNGNGVPDLVALETNKHQILIAELRPDAIHYALKFPVFEQRIFERGGRGGREPREIIIADLNGDSLNDIAILVHDRLIVYPQEPF